MQVVIIWMKKMKNILQRISDDQFGFAKESGVRGDKFVMRQPDGRC